MLIVTFKVCFSFYRKQHFYIQFLLGLPYLTLPQISAKLPLSSNTDCKHFLISTVLIVFTVSTLLNVKLCETETGRYVSVLDLPGNVLIVPQATLGGKAKGKSMQYHANIGKEEGMQLYTSFVAQCEKELSSSSKCTESGVLVKHGTYGNRQVLKLDTNGPYTHLIEF